MVPRALLNTEALGDSRRVLVRRDVVDRRVLCTARVRFLVLPRDENATDEIRGNKGERGSVGRIVMHAVIVGPRQRRTPARLCTW